MMLPESNQKDDTQPKVESESPLSARLGAESALGEFQQKIHDHPTDQEAKDAFARLVVGRGFDRPRPTPVMTIHSAIVTGESKEAVEPKPAATKSQGLTGFLRGLAERMRS